jgi:hypothetical protein
MQKTYIFSMQIGKPQANALKSIGYTDTVLLLTTGKPDMYQLESLGKLANFFHTGDLPNLSAIDIQLTNIRRLYIYCNINSPEEYCIRIKILDAFASGIPVCTGNR